MTSSSSSSTTSNNMNNSSAISSDQFPIRDLLLWNPFQQQRNSKGSTTTTKPAENDEHEEEEEEDTKKYDNHWILILNGSYKGYFDWIPMNLRVGKWSMMSILYFRLLWCFVIYLLLYDIQYHQTNPTSDNVCSVSVNNTSSNTATAAQQQQQQCDALTHIGSSSFKYFLHGIVQRYWKHNADTILQMSPVIIQSSSFYYNTIVAIYMTYICYCIIAYSPLSYGAWITYTVQSWTLLFIRHWLYTLSGLFDTVSTTTSMTETNTIPILIHTNNNNNNNNFVVLAELLRFPCAVAHTVTFVIWNFVLVPYILMITLRNDPQKRHDFIRFCTSFRLVNLHGMNILFCIGNVWYFNSHTIIGMTTTNRSLEMADLYFAGISAFLYFTFYLCILDRIGIHLYPIFSPRHSNAIVFIVWTSVILLYIATFHLWQYIIKHL